MGIHVDPIIFEIIRALREASSHKKGTQLFIKIRTEEKDGEQMLFAYSKHGQVCYQIEIYSKKIMCLIKNYDETNDHMDVFFLNPQLKKISARAHFDRDEKREISRKEAKRIVAEILDAYRTLLISVVYSSKS